MKTVLFGMLAAATVAVAVPASVEKADAQVVVKERTVVRPAMVRKRCFTERTKVYRGNREIVRVKRVCR